MRTVAALLAEFALAQRARPLPGEVRTAVVQHLIDQAAVQLDGSDRPSVRIVREWARDQSRDGDAIVVGTNMRLAPVWAAIVNAAAATAFENDDYHPGGLIHAYSAVVPAVLAVGEVANADLEDALKAIAVGVEAATRISVAAQPGMNSGRGIHPTSAVAPFGVALAVGMLRDLDVEQLTEALGICGSFSGGVLEYSRSGGQVKRLHTSIAAEAGIRAVELAALGLDGPHTVIEGAHGVLSAFSDTYNPVTHNAELTSALGERWELLGTAIKPFFTNGLIQGPIHAVLRLCRENGLKAGDIERVEIGVDSMAAKVCAPSAIPPRDLVDAQFSLPFGVALAIVTGGSTLAQYQLAERAGFDLADVTALARRVTFHVDPEADRLFPKRFNSTTQVVTVDAEYRLTVDAPGTAENPLSAQELDAKWRTALDRNNAGRYDTVRRILGEAACRRRVHDLTTQLTAAPASERTQSP